MMFTSNLIFSCLASFLLFVSLCSSLPVASSSGIENIVTLPYNFTLSAYNVTLPNTDKNGAPLVLGQNGAHSLFHDSKTMNQHETCRCNFWCNSSCDLGTSIPKISPKQVKEILMIFTTGKREFEFTDSRVIPIRRLSNSSSYRRFITRIPCRWIMEHQCYRSS